MKYLKLFENFRGRGYFKRERYIYKNKKNETH